MSDSFGKSAAVEENESQQIAIYQSEDGFAQVEVNVVDETVWLSQAQMCALFDKNKRTVSEHLRNIFKEGELLEPAVVRKFRTTASDGKSFAIQSCVKQGKRIKTP